MTPPDESQFLKLSVAGSLKKKKNFQAFLILIINLVKQNKQNRVSKCIWIYVGDNYTLQVW